MIIYVIWPSAPELVQGLIYQLLGIGNHAITQTTIKKIAISEALGGYTVIS